MPSDGSAHHSISDEPLRDGDGVVLPEGEPHGAVRGSLAGLHHRARVEPRNLEELGIGRPGGEVGVGEVGHAERGVAEGVHVGRLEDGDGGSPDQDSFSIELDSGSIEDQMDDYVSLSEDASGTITFDDGSQLAFDGIERIEW